jgi:predicted NAD/FAD-dependent oxidoreductase
MKEEHHQAVVIGAGVSGLSAAQRLREAGIGVIVLEKSRGLGGRLATRRVRIADDMEVPVDHGAQFFTARDPRFIGQVSRWENSGICFPWVDDFEIWSHGKLQPADPHFHVTRYACSKGMNTIGRNLSEGLDVRREFLVSSVSFTGGLFKLSPDSSSDNATILAKELFISAPVPQALALAGNFLSPEQRRVADGIGFSPCIAVMARYDEGQAHPPWKGIQVRDPQSKLSWVGWDSSRRGGGTPGRIAVLHGSADFSKRWLGASREELQSAGRELLEEAASVIGVWMANPLEIAVHRWRYAHARVPGVPDGFLRAPGNPGLYLIGDGLNGGRVEGAWLSGLLAVEHRLTHAHA